MSLPDYLGTHWPGRVCMKNPQVQCMSKFKQGRVTGITSWWLSMPGLGMWYMCICSCQWTVALTHHQGAMNGMNQAPVQAEVAPPSDSEEKMGLTFIKTPQSTGSNSDPSTSDKTAGEEVLVPLRRSARMKQPLPHSHMCDHKWKQAHVRFLFCNDCAIHQHDYRN